MKLAIVTVDYNGHADTAEFLQSAAKLTLPKSVSAKFIVVDNGSDTPVEKHLPETNLDVEVVQTGKNIGFTGGYNRGIRYGLQWGADYILFVNNDVLFPDKTLIVKLLDALEENPQAGVASPKILFAPGFEFHKDRYTKTQLGQVIWYAGGSFDWNNVASVHRGVDEVDAGQFDATGETDFVSGCCVLVRAEVFKKVGFFEEKLFAYFEDADWIERLKMSGWKQLYVGSASLHHKVSQTSGVGSPMTDYLLTRNRLYFGFKYASFRTRFALARQALGFLITGRAKQRQGVIDFIRNKYGFDTPDRKVEYPVKLSIVSINYKTLDLTIKLLESVFDKKSGFYDQVSEMILIDNASEDGIADVVAKRFPQVKFIGNTENKGFSGANNQGIDYSRGEHVLLLNSDIVVHPHSLSRLSSWADKLGGRAALSGKLFFPDGTLQDSCSKLPTVAGAIKEYFLGIKGSYFMFVPPGDKPTPVECAVMACYLIPTRTILELGKLDEGTFMYFEDIEYSRRLKNAHIPLYFIPDASFTHFHGASSKKIGQLQAYQLSKKGSLYYHGRLKYEMLRVVLWLGLRFGVVANPVSRWTKEENK